MEQFRCNLGIFTQKELNRIRNAQVLIVGAGGLGGYLANGFVRMGVKSIVVVDNDRFEKRNLNRQLFSSHENLGRFKSDVVVEALDAVSPDTHLMSCPFSVEDLDDETLKGVDMIVDAAGNAETKKYLEKLAETYKKPLLHGAIGGWYGQVGIVLPGKGIVNKLYDSSTRSVEEDLRCPTFTPAVVANLMVTEFAKYYGGKKALVNRILLVNLLEHTYDILFDDDAE